MLMYLPIFLILNNLFPLTKTSASIDPSQVDSVTQRPSPAPMVAYNNFKRTMTD